MSRASLPTQSRWGMADYAKVLIPDEWGKSSDKAGKAKRGK